MDLDFFLFCFVLHLAFSIRKREVKYSKSKRKWNEMLISNNYIVINMIMDRFILMMMMMMIIYAISKIWILNFKHIDKLLNKLNKQRRERQTNKKTTTDRQVELRQNFFLCIVISGSNNHHHNNHSLNFFFVCSNNKQNRLSIIRSLLHCTIYLWYEHFYFIIQNNHLSFKYDYIIFSETKKNWKTKQKKTNLISLRMLCF